jgi:hypothetical protein
LDMRCLLTCWPSVLLTSLRWPHNRLTCVLLVAVRSVPAFSSTSPPSINS